MPFGGAGHLGDHIFYAPEAKPFGTMPLEPGFWHYAAELCTLSVTYPLCGLALTNTTDILSEIFLQKLTDFYLFWYHRSYTILRTKAAYSPNGFH